MDKPLNPVIGSKYVFVGQTENSTYPNGLVVTLVEDDGSIGPYFKVDIEQPTVKWDRSREQRAIFWSRLKPYNPSTLPTSFFKLLNLI